MILNLEEPTLSKKLLDDTFKRQFEKNDPKVGGSFYLQSKLFRAHEALETSLKKKEQGITEDDEDPAPGTGAGAGSSSSKE